jgi:hypothetical protein
VEGGSCNDYDYVCGDPVNGFDLDGRKGNRPLENRDAECLGGTYAQITSDPCRAYQLAKVTGNSDFYYEGKTYSTPGKPNAALKYIGDRLKPVLVDRAGETLRLCAEGARAGAAVGAVAAAQTSAASVAAGAIGGCGADVGIAVAGQFIEAGAAVLPLLDDAFDAYQFIQGVRRRL